MQLILGFFSRALRALGGDEDILANVRQHVAVNLFGMPVPVSVSAIEIVQAQIVSVAHLKPGGLLGAQSGPGGRHPGR